MRFAHDQRGLRPKLVFLVQRGQYREADAIRRKILALSGPYSPLSTTPIAFAMAAIPARYALERQAWSEAADLSLHQPAAFPWGKQYLNCDSIVHFARTIGAARSGRLDAAQTEIAGLERMHRELSTAKGPAYWVAQAETQMLAARAWVQFAQKKPDDAIALLRRATQLEMRQTRNRSRRVKSCPPEICWGIC